jgi:GH15 family glucan-1,4-alpha-glucosidase
MHKYQPDRAIGSTWHPLLHGKRKELAIQEDETAIVLFMLGEYRHYSHDVDFVRNLYATFVQPAANFLASFIDPATHLPHASYDLWEEKFLTSTYTTAVVHQALLVAAGFAEDFEFPDDASLWRKVAHTIQSVSSSLFDPVRMMYRKGLLLSEEGEINYDTTLDISSLYGPMMFGLDNSDNHSYTKATYQAVESMLLNQSPSNGLPRYEHDHYFESSPAFMGNPWFVATLWLAQYYIRLGEVQKARGIVEWTMGHALPSGALSEQINPTTGAPVSVTPLVWSHAEFINTVLDLVEPSSN